MKQNKNLLKVILGSVALVALVLGMFSVYQNLKPQAQQGSKTVVVDVVIPDQKTEEFTLKTDAEFLRQALEEKELIKGSESDYGLYITEVNGRAANDANQEWWCITKSGEQVMYGVDEIAISDGDHYEITLTIGY